MKLFYVLIMLSSLNACKSEQDFWVYKTASHQHHQGSLTISKEERYVAFNDVQYSASFCNGGNYYCLISESLSFSVPVNIAAETTWKNQGVTFFVKEKKMIYHNGFDINVHIIKRKSAIEGEDLSYIYSSKYGLISVVSESGEEARVVGVYGFPKGLKESSCK